MPDGVLLLQLRPSEGQCTVECALTQKRKRKKTCRSRVVDAVGQGGIAGCMGRLDGQGKTQEGHGGKVDKMDGGPTAAAALLAACCRVAVGFCRVHGAGNAMHAAYAGSISAGSKCCNVKERRHQRCQQYQAGGAVPECRSLCEQSCTASASAIVVVAAVHGQHDNQCDDDSHPDNAHHQVGNPCALLPADAQRVGGRRQWRVGGQRQAGHGRRRSKCWGRYMRQWRRPQQGHTQGHQVAAVMAGLGAVLTALPAGLPPRLPACLGSLPIRPPAHPHVSPPPTIRP